MLESGCDLEVEGRSDGGVLGASSAGGVIDAAAVGPAGFSAGGPRHRNSKKNLRSQDLKQL